MPRIRCTPPAPRLAREDDLGHAIALCKGVGSFIVEPARRGDPYVVLSRGREVFRGDNVRAIVDFLRSQQKGNARGT